MAFRELSSKMQRQDSNLIGNTREQYELVSDGGAGSVLECQRASALKRLAEKWLCVGCADHAEGAVLPK